MGRPADLDRNEPAAEQVVHHYHHAPKSGGTAALLEILFGFFFQTFGIGHIYAGNVGLGLLFMFGYWVLSGVNVLLMFVLIGFVSYPLCFVGMLILSPILAAKSCSAR